jgi:hypothetical protein
MSQSKSAYGTQNPKGTGKRQCQQHRQSSTEAGTEPSPEPACRSRHVSDWEWIEIPCTAALTASYTPCEWDDCFGDSPPDANEIETVVRSRRYPSVYHRCYSDTTDHHSTRERDDPTDEEGPADTHPVFETHANAAQKRESIESVTNLCEGDGVTWNALETSLVVVEKTDSANYRLEGPAGGEYELRKRYDGALLVYPGYGHIDGLSRVMPAGDRPQLEAV